PTSTRFPYTTLFRSGYLIGRILVAALLLPRYFSGRLETAYALLGERFGPRTRRFTSVIFMVTRAFADSIRVFAAAIPIQLVTGIDRKSTRLNSSHVK